MAQDQIKARLAGLDAVRDERGLDAVAAIKRGLADRNALVVAKAAKIAGNAALKELVADIVAAYHRMVSDGSDDPGCQAGNSLAEALRDLGYRDPAPFLAGLAHVRLEHVWGGRVDVAGPFRATCAQALVATDINPHALMILLVDRFADTDKWVRIDVARAIAQLDRPESALLLRLKALAGDADAEVVGQCLISLLELEAGTALDFIARFLTQSSDAVALEALATLAQSKLSDAFERIKQYWSETIDPHRRTAIVKVLAASPHREAAQFLFGVLERNDGNLAGVALESIAESRFRNEWRERAGEVVAKSGSAALRRAFDRAFD